VSAEIPSLCHRCGVELAPGLDNFYVVKIEAFADPTPPIISTGQTPKQVAEEIERLIDQTRDMSEQELMDQVHRRLTLYLCSDCYRHWIEQPVG